MTRETFVREMVKAMILPASGRILTTGRATSEASVGPTTGGVSTEEEPNLWLSLADDEVDETRRERGRGYRDGLAI